MALLFPPDAPAVTRGVRNRRRRRRRIRCGSATPESPRRQLGLSIGQQLLRQPRGPSQLRLEYHLWISCQGEFALESHEFLLIDLLARLQIDDRVLNAREFGTERRFFCTRSDSGRGSRATNIARDWSDKRRIIDVSDALQLTEQRPEVGKIPRLLRRQRLRLGRSLDTSAGKSSRTGRSRCRRRRKGRATSAGRWRRDRKSPRNSATTFGVRRHRRHGAEQRAGIAWHLGAPTRIGKSALGTTVLPRRRLVPRADFSLRGHSGDGPAPGRRCESRAGRPWDGLILAAHERAGRSSRNWRDLLLGAR